MHSPTIINRTPYSIVVFLERGILYNYQVLGPNEALSLTRWQTGGLLVPYRVHVVVGDQTCLPTRQQSMRNLASSAVIPTAFCVGALAAAVSAGTLVGPSAALAPLVSGLVVNGIVIDAAAITAGGLVASRVAVVADLLVQKNPENFMARSSRLRPGKRYVVVEGGLDQGPLQIKTIKEREFRRLGIEEFKEPIDRTLKDKLQFHLPMLLKQRDDQPPTSIEEDAVTI